MWKPLSIVSGLVLVGTGGLMHFVVKPLYQSEMAQNAASKTNLELANAHLAKATTNSNNARADLAKSETFLTEAQSKKEAAKTAKAKAVKDTEDAQTQKDADEKALAELSEKLKGLGGLDEVVAKLKTLEAKKAQLESDKKNTIDATAALVAHKKATDEVIAALKLREIYQKTGTVKEGSSTRIVEVSPEMGYFGFAGGNNSNITKNSKWDVVRDNTIIARLVVTNIQQSQSIAELVPGTLVQGNQVMPGDRVVVSASSTPRALAASITAAAKKGTAPAAKGAKQPDGTAPPAETPMADPFAPAPTPAPAPAPAPAETTPSPAPAPAESTPPAEAT